MLKTTALIVAAAAALSGCAGLNVSWSATASYNTNAATQAQTIHLTSPTNEKKQ